MDSEATTHNEQHPRVGVVTVSYGSADALHTFLSSLRAYEDSALPVVVVDNKPDSENVRDLSAQFGAHYIPLPENPGYSAGMNAGAAWLLSRYPEREFDTLFFCNPDLRFIGPMVSGLAETLHADCRYGSIGPRLLNSDGTVYPSARNIPSVRTGIGHALFSKIWKSNPWTRAYQAADNTEQLRSAGSLSGAAVMTPRHVFELIDGWDEEYFLHFEDIDLGWRIGKNGLLNIYAPQFAVEHSGAHSTQKHTEMVERAQTQSAIRFLGKRYPGWQYAPLRALINAGLHIRLAIKLRAS